VQVGQRVELACDKRRLLRLCRQRARARLKSARFVPGSPPPLEPRRRRPARALKHLFLRRARWRDAPLSLRKTSHLFDQPQRTTSTIAGNALPWPARARAFIITTTHTSDTHDPPPPPSAGRPPSCRDARAPGVCEADEPAGCGAPPPADRQHGPSSLSHLLRHDHYEPPDPSRGSRARGGGGRVPPAAAARHDAGRQASAACRRARGTGEAAAAAVAAGGDDDRARAARARAARSSSSVAVALLFLSRRPSSASLARAAAGRGARRGCPPRAGHASP
jgi:hypothetical protein